MPTTPLPKPKKQKIKDPIKGGGSPKRPKAKDKLFGFKLSSQLSKGALARLVAKETGGRLTDAEVAQLRQARQTTDSSN